MPGDIPKYIRVYDNGGGSPWFCRSCLLFSDDDPVDQKCECGHKLIAVDQKFGTFDRYTVVFTGRYPGRQLNECHYVGMSARPFHPQGFGQHGEHNGVFDVNESGFPPKVGDRAYWGYGRRITFQQLPKDCQRLVRRDYVLMWNLDPKQKEAV